MFQFVFLILCEVTWCSAVFETITGVLLNENPQNCVISPPAWVEDSSYDDIQNFIYEEQHLFNQCKEMPTYYMSGDFQQPEPCQALTLCNTTYCLQFQPEALRHFYSVKSSCLSKYDTESGNVKFMSVEAGPPKFQILSVFHLFDLLTNAKFDKKKYFFDNHTPSSRSNFHYASKYCPNVAERNFFIEGLGELPTQCSRVKFCDIMSQMCYSVPFISMKHAFTFPRKEDPDYKNLALPATCHVVNLDRSRRHISLYTEYGMSKRQPISQKDQPFGLLNFNLPGFRYCGPGTNVEVMDDLGGPVNELDYLCRQHDVDYLIGMPADLADEKLLKGMWMIRHPFLPLFVAVFEAKRYYESIAGDQYTSSLYYFPEGQKSLTYFVSKKSVYDNGEGSLNIESEIQGKRLEERWIKILHEIWSGHCYSTALPGINQLGKGDENTQKRPQSADTVGSNPRPGTSKKTKTAADDNEEDEQIDASARLVAYPNAPYQPSNCRVLLSEVLPLTYDEFGTRSVSFIEFKRLCPSYVPNPRASSLYRFHLLIIEIGEPSVIHLTQDLDYESLKPVVEVPNLGARAKQMYYFVLGSNTMNPHKSFDSVSQGLFYDGYKGVPSEVGKTYAIVLLYFPTVKEAEQHRPFLNFERTTTPMIPRTVDDVQRYIIKDYIQDMFIYGAPCDREICGEFTSLLPKQTQILDLEDNTYSPVPIPTNNPLAGSANIRYNSCNRCTDSILPMELDDFIEAPATPGSKNNCPKLNPAFKKFNGVRLQSTAQMVIQNVFNYFNMYAGDPSKFERKSVTEMTSDATLVNPSTIRKITEKVKAGVNLQTPSRTPVRKKPVQCQIDSFKADMIRRIIQDSYANNVAPMAKDIYTQFMTKVAENERVREQQGEPDFLKFKCSEKTFRKILHSLGYRYGRINTRDALLMRPDIVSWRGRYLTEMRRNRKSAEPMKIIWLDETWIDPHARTGKAWVPKKARNYRERRMYSFHKHKVSRGGRIIVLNAGGEDGFVPGALRIYPVKKNAATGDYHENVNADVFIDWFENLLKILTATGKKYIIVMDNAPYHGRADMPKSNAKKQEMYDWLKEHLEGDEANEFLPIKEYYRHELWDMIKAKKKSSNFYVLDQMAAKYGHKVVRLPPYNCDLSPIEECWKDTKHAVRQSNVDQNIKTIIEIATKVMNEYPADKWKAHIRHIERLEEEYWKADGFYEEFFDRNFNLIIPITDDDDEDDDADELTSYENSDYNVVPIEPGIVTSIVHDSMDEFLAELDELGITA